MVVLAGAAFMPLRPGYQERRGHAATHQRVHQTHRLPGRCATHRQPKTAVGHPLATRPSSKERNAQSKVAALMNDAIPRFQSGPEGPATRSASNDGPAGRRSHELRPTDDCCHQQYLAKNPNGYRCHSATGVPMPWPVEGVETKLG